MIWFFERNRAHLRYEIRRQPDGPDFELVITQPDGAQQVERYATATDLALRSGVLCESLYEQGWRPLGGSP